MTMANKKDAGFSMRSVYAGEGTATAAGSGDNVAVNGPWIDRLRLSSGVITSAKAVVAYKAALANTKTLSFAIKLQDADDAAGLNAADVVDSLNATNTGVVIAETGTGTTNTGCAEADFYLEKARRFVRLVITPDLSNTATDTLSWTAILATFGGDRAPVTRSPI